MLISIGIGGCIACVIVIVISCVGSFLWGRSFGKKEIDEEYSCIENLLEIERDINKDLMKKLAQSEELQRVEGKSEIKENPLFKYKIEASEGRVLWEVEGFYNNVATEINRATKGKALYDLIISMKKGNAEE